MTFRAAVVEYGRIGSTIDDEHQNKPQFRYPGVHTPRLYRSQGGRVGDGIRSEASTTGRI